MKIAHIFISGFVQGVGYRRFVRHNAVKLELRGWVKNLPDNRVEAVISGSEQEIEKLISICKKGPFLSEVKDVVAEWGNGLDENFTSFEIHH